MLNESWFDLCTNFVLFLILIRSQFMQWLKIRKFLLHQPILFVWQLSSLPKIVQNWFCTQNLHMDPVFGRIHAFFLNTLLLPILIVATQPPERWPQHQSYVPNIVESACSCRSTWEIGWGEILEYSLKDKLLCVK